jgi:hypothetical protein
MTALLLSRSTMPEVNVIGDVLQIVEDVVEVICWHIKDGVVGR